MTPSTTLMASILLALATPTAHAELVEIVWSGSGAFTQHQRIAAGTFVEVCGKLQAGVNVAWSFEASAPTDFNIHYHEGKDVVFPAKMAQVARSQDTLHVKIEQDYCWMWTNKTAVPAVLKASFQR